MPTHTVVDSIRLSRERTADVRRWKISPAPRAALLVPRSSFQATLPVLHTRTALRMLHFLRRAPHPVTLSCAPRGRSSCCAPRVVPLAQWDTARLALYPSLCAPCAASRGGHREERIAMSASPRAGLLALCSSFCAPRAVLLSLRSSRCVSRAALLALCSS